MKPLKKMRKIFFSWKIKLKIKLNIIKIRYNLYSSITNLQLILLIMRLTLSFLTIILILLTSEKLFSQNEKYPYSQQGKENLELINKQKENSQLTEEEKTVVVLTNFVRINPKLKSKLGIQTFLNDLKNSMLNKQKSMLKIAIMEIKEVMTHL